MPDNIHDWDEIDDDQDSPVVIDPDSWRVFTPGDDPDDDEELELETREAFPPRAELEQVLDALVRGEHHFDDLRAFSDLDSDDVALLESRWPHIGPELRASVIRESSDLSQDTFDLQLSRFLRFATTDDNPAVRQLAVGALAFDADKGSLETLLGILTGDISDDVRAEAAASLGPYATYAEYDELDQGDRDRLRATLLDVAEDEDEPWHVRRRAAEASAVFGDDPRVLALIQRMWDEEDLGLRASALFSIGRGQITSWLPSVIDAFADEDAAIRFEAVRAAGALGDVTALPDLSELALEDDDDDVRHATILAIGEIGGPGAIRILSRLQGRVSAADQIVVDTALTEASLEADPLLAEVELESTWQDDPDPE